MAMQAPITGAFKRAPNLGPPMVQIGSFDAITAAPTDLSRADRDWVSNLIEMLIGLVDQYDGDPDNEDGDADQCNAYDDHVGESLAHFDRLAQPGDLDDSEDEELDTGNAEDEVLTGDGWLAADNRAGPGCIASDPPAIEAAEAECATCDADEYERYRQNIRALCANRFALPYRFPNLVPIADHLARGSRA